MRLAPVALLVLFCGCGTNRPEIPPELIGGGSSCNAPDYPDGPYGTEEGDTAANVCFRGWKHPDTASHTSASLQTVALSSYLDETGERYELVLLNTAALWCSACQIEHRALPGRYATYGPRGLAIIGALFQDEKAEPADVTDLKNWVEAFDVTYTMALDPEYQLGAYASAETAPLNIVIDARTMTILKKYVGDQSALLWPFIDDELGRREAAK